MIRVDGADAVAAGLVRAGDVLLAGDPRTAAAMTRAMVGAVHPPRRTGRLAGTVRAEISDANQPGITAGSPAVRYAAVHEWGSPSRGITGSAYMRRAVASTETAWMTAYTNGVTDTLNTI